MLKKQNFDLVLALNSCLEAEQIDYLSLWNKVRAQRHEFESASLKGLTPRQAVVLRTARLDFESRVLELWQGIFLETLGPVLELNWLQTSLIEKLLQRDRQLRMRLLLNVALSWEKLERSWNDLSEQFEKQLEAILSADQRRNYRELTTMNKWLVAE